MNSLEIIARGRAKKEAQAPYTRENMKPACTGKKCRRTNEDIDIECNKCKRLFSYHSKTHKTVVVFDPEDLRKLELLGIRHTY